MQQLNQAQRQQQISQLVQQQQMESNIKQNQQQTNPIQTNPMQNSAMQNNPLQSQGQSVSQAQGVQQMSGQQQWNFNQMNQMQGTSGQNQPSNTAQPQQQAQPQVQAQAQAQAQSQQFFNQAGMNRFERPQMNNPTSKQALSMMLRQRHPSSFMNAANNPQQPNMSGLPFNMQQRQQMMRTAAMRNVNPAQIQAAAANNQMNVNSIGNPMMSGGGMVQQRQVSSP